MSVAIDKGMKEKLNVIYPESEADNNLVRYENLKNKFTDFFGESEVRFFSAPGRTELGGNHTDHNKGLVLAASVQLDTIAAVGVNGNSEVVVYSDDCGNEPFRVNLNDLQIVKKEKGKLSSIIRGIAAWFETHGYKTGGFNAVISSDIPFGSGLSSSASVEVLLGEIFNSLYNSGSVSKKEIALAGQYAENEYFGKPCGLMDQLACAYGGIVKIDFGNGIEIENISFDFEKSGFDIFVVETGKNHSDLTDDYSEIIEDMKRVADFFNAENLRGIAPEEFYEKIPALRESVSERAILRAIHYFEENERVKRQAEALNKKDINLFLRLVDISGKSSALKLQNLFSLKNPEEQTLLLALSLTERFLRNGKGAARVHGGGFAGTIQVYVSTERSNEFKEYIEKYFGAGSAYKLKIRKLGVTEIN